eukprot:3087112-Amphidinium_carterae.1
MGLFQDNTLDVKSNLCPWLCAFSRVFRVQKGLPQLFNDVAHLLRTTGPQSLHGFRQSMKTKSDGAFLLLSSRAA